MPILVAPDTGPEPFYLEVECGQTGGVGEVARSPVSVVGSTRRAGSLTANVLPCPSSLSISSSAWCRSSTCLTIARPRPGAAGRARAAAIDAIEALGQPRNVLGRDADARVGHREHAGAVRVDAPCERDRAARRRVADRVADEVAERARELVAAAEDRRGVADVERDVVLPLATAPSPRRTARAAAARSRTAPRRAGCARSRARTA